jgi:hypothetical protein
MQLKYRARARDADQQRIGSNVETMECKSGLTGGDKEELQDVAFLKNDKGLIALLRLTSWLSTTVIGGKVEPTSTTTKT